MGLSGSGKSTFLRCLNGIIPATSGTVTIADTTLDPKNQGQLTQIRRQYMAMVFQHFGLLPHRTVGDNAGFGLEIQGQKAAQRAQAIQTARESLGQIHATRTLRRYAATSGFGAGAGHGSTHYANGRALQRIRSDHPARNAR